MYVCMYVCMYYYYYYYYYLGMTYCVCIFVLAILLYSNTIHLIYILKGGR